MSIWKSMRLQTTEQPNGFVATTTDNIITHLCFINLRLSRVGFIVYLTFIFYRIDNKTSMRNGFHLLYFPMLDLHFANLHQCWSFVQHLALRLPIVHSMSPNRPIQAQLFAFCSKYNYLHWFVYDIALYGTVLMRHCVLFVALNWCHLVAPAFSFV